MARSSIWRRDRPCCFLHAQVPKAQPPWQGLAREARALLHVIEYGTWDDLVQRSTLGQALRGLKNPT